MSSYHSSFSYLNKNSKNDFEWLIVSFDPDNGEADSYLTQEQVYTDSYRGTKRILYGTRYDAVAIVKITVIKKDGSDFSLDDCRKAYRWLTGNPKANWLDLYAGDTIKYSVLCTVQDVRPQKLDARTVGLDIYFESISPWAYSSLQSSSYAFGQELIAEDGILDGNTSSFVVVEDNVAHNDSKVLQTTDNGALYVDNSVMVQINNETDDLYTPVYLNVTLRSGTSDYLSIKNKTLNEETILTGMSTNEVITISAGQFIISDMPGKIFGNDFNFVWPKLAPGFNDIVISGSGVGRVDFNYRYPIKIGDCAIDIGELEDEC